MNPITTNDSEIVVRVEGFDGCLPFIRAMYRKTRINAYAAIAIAIYAICMGLDPPYFFYPNVLPVSTLLMHEKIL